MIAVVLLVALTVVMAAGVYTWVSGMGEGQTAAGTLGAAATEEEAGYVRPITVTSASPGLAYGDLELMVSESLFDFVGGASADGEWGASRGGVALGAADVVRAGDVIRVDAASSTAGGTLRVVQESANQVLLTLRLR